MITTELSGPSYYRVSGTLIDKYKRETQIWPRTFHDGTVVTGTRYHSIVLGRYSPVRSKGIMPKDTCRNAMTGPIIAQQGYYRPNDIKSERPNFWTYIKAAIVPISVLCRYGPMTGPIIVLRRYGPVRETHIMNKGTCNKTVSGQMT